jgi:hypothetical protein
MSDTMINVLRVLNDSLDLQYSPEVANRKALTAQVLAIIAVAEELQKANEMKKKELLRLYGDRFL